MRKIWVSFESSSQQWYLPGHLLWPKKLAKGFDRQRRRGVLLLFLFLFEAFVCFIPSARAQPSWWNQNYAYRVQITITAGSVIVPTSYTVQVTFNHAGLVSAGKSQADGDDVRIVYWTGSAWSELDRALNESSSWNVASTKILFKTQAAISASSSDNNYYMYYGNSGAVNPPENKDNVYLDYDDFESYTVGSAPTGWTVRSGTWIVSNDGGNKVLNATGSGGTKRYIDKDGISVDNVAVRARVKIVENPASQINGGPIARESGTGESDLTAYVVTVVKNTDRTELGRLYPGGYSSLASTSETINIGTWYVVLLTVYSNQEKGYRDGVLKGSATDSNIGSAGRVGLYSYTAANSKRVYFDNFIARKFVNPEPTTSLGSEEPRVGTSTVNTATYQPFQRKSFYAYGRFWVFYSDGTNMKFSSSTDGFNWGTPTTVSTGITIDHGEKFSIWFDGTYVHYACCGQASGNAIYYRRGTPNSDGTITWSTQQTAVSGSSPTAYVMPCIAVDSNSYPWIGYRKIPDTAAPTTTYPFVTKSNKTDGTWSTDTANGFPKDLAGWSLSHWFVVPVPLTGGKITCLFSSHNNYIRARSWSGSSWGTDKTTASGVSNVYLSAVAQGDEVHVVFLKDSSVSIIKYCKYTYHSTNPSWGSEVDVQGAVGNYVTPTSAPVLSINTQNNVLYCFWASHPTTNYIYYKKYSGGQWDSSPTSWIVETTDSLTGNDLLTCFYSSYDFKIGLVYMTKTSSPYNVRFKYLSMPIVPEYPYGPFLLLLICIPIYYLTKYFRKVEG